MLRSRSAFTARSRSLGVSARARMMSSSAVGVLSVTAAGLSSARLMAFPPDWRKIAPGADPDQERPVPTETWLYVRGMLLNGNPVVSENSILQIRAMRSIIASSDAMLATVHLLAQHQRSDRGGDQHRLGGR